MSLIFKNITPSSPYILRHPSRLFKSSVFNFSLQVFICTDNCQRPPGHCKFRDESFVDMVLSSAVSSQKHVLGYCFQLCVYPRCCVLPKGLCKEENNSKHPRLLGKWVGGSRSRSEFFCLENLPKIALNQY